VKRAYDAAAKDERRKAILDAAARLLEQADGSLPSASEIAAASGLAKGTLYIYFRTKEEIFAALLLHLWQPALAMLEEEIVRADRPVAARVEAFVTRFVNYVEERPSLLRLDALSKEVIERNMSLPALITHKEAFLERIEAGASRIEDALKLQPGRGFQLVTRTHAMARGLWQSFGGPDPSLIGYHRYSFPEELRGALLEYWRGVTTTPPDDLSKSNG
jgi:AcrR family transcriptional regulator